MRSLTTDMTKDDLRPYFLWDEDITIHELREKLKTGTPWERERLLGKMLREARDIDVWHFTTPREVADVLPRIARRIGRRAPFWEFLIGMWRKHGLLG